MNTVKMSEAPEDKEDNSLEWDEEPHLLEPALGFGYYPVALGQIIDAPGCKLGKLEIVRKLGWDSTATVWLARICEYVPFYNVSSGTLH